MMSAAMATHRNDSNDETHLLSVRKAAEFLSVSDVTIRRFLTHKKLRRFKAGGRTLVRMSDLMELVKEVK